FLKMLGEVEVMMSEALLALRRPQHAWWLVSCLLIVLALATLMGRASLTIALALVAVLAVGCVGLLLIGFRQYALIATGCICVAIFVDWLPLPPYPFGGPGISIAPIMALVVLIFLLTYEKTLTGWGKGIGWWFWAALLVLGAPALLSSVEIQ